METLAIIGTGGFGKQVLPLAQRLRSTRDCRVVFAETQPSEDSLGGIPLVAIADLPRDASYVVAVAGAETRVHVAKQMAEGSSPAGRLISPDAKVSPDAQIGKGAIICDFAVVEPFVKIGLHFHANVFAFVAHDCVVGDFVTLGPRATCNGNVHIGDRAYIGAGAIIRQGTSRDPLIIGENAFIGMGAVVTRDVPAGATVVGNPAKPLEPQD